MTRAAGIVLLCFVVSLVFSCAVSKPTTAPPPVKKEMRPRQPGPNYLWISGHWKWSAGKYIWVPGHWTKQRAGQSWIPGHWEQKGRTWVWIAGRWK